jgi:hypothetical protein
MELVDITHHTLILRERRKNQIWRIWEQEIGWQRFCFMYEIRKIDCEIEFKYISAFQMSDVAQGGATVFTKLNVGAWPKKGSAVFWHNLHATGERDYRTLHAGCPVLLGNKWGETIYSVLSIIFFLCVTYFFLQCAINGNTFMGRSLDDHVHFDLTIHA